MTTETAANDGHADQVFYDLHYRASVFYLRHTSSMVRSFLEWFWMLLAVSGFAALICLHLAFVYRGNPTPAAASAMSFQNISHHPLRNIPTTCLTSVSGFSSSAAVTHLVLIDDNDNEQQSATSIAWELGTSFPSNSAKQGAASEECSVTDLNNPVCSSSKIISENVYFSFSRTKAYALMSPELSEMHGISTQIVAVSKTDVRCFGESFLQTIVFRVLGPDLVMMNWLLAISNGTGFIYNPRTDETVDLRKFSIVNVRRKAKSRGPNNTLSALLDWDQWYNLARSWTSKFRTAIKTCLIYFISTNLVSFLMRVAQERLLELSIQIRCHQQEHRSIIPLFVTHVADCFIFVPITVGVLFYLREFFSIPPREGDWVIALTVLALVFLGELFSFVSVRTPVGVYFFPRAFFLLFCLVHFYVFSFPFGFSKVAMGMIVCFILQCCTFFWNRYEVPAVVLGRLTLDDYNREIIVSNNIQVPSRHVTGSEEAVSTINQLNRVDPLARSPDTVFRVGSQPQSQSPMHYTYSQGRMSRASSEAIFQRADPDDESEQSCLYFLGGEVVIRGADGGQRGNAASSTRMNTYDSMSTLQSAMGPLGTITDEAATSSLQAIHNLNSSPGSANTENAAGSRCATLRR